MSWRWLVALCAALAVAPSARAQAGEPEKQKAETPTERAERLFNDGRAELEQRHYDAACARFRESLAAEPSIAAQLNLGLCHEEAGRLAAAIGAYLRAHQMAIRAGDAERAQAAADKAASLSPRVARIALRGRKQPAGLEVWIDGARVEADLAAPIPVDPGEHAIELRAHGLQSVSTHATLAPGGLLELAPPSRARPPDNTIAAPSPPRGLVVSQWVELGLGGVGLVAGAAAGALAMAARSRMDDSCPDKICSTEEGQRDHQAAQARATISTAAFAIGGALVGLGLVTIGISYGAARPRPALAIVPTLGGAMLNAAF